MSPPGHRRPLRGTDIFPQLRELRMFTTVMSDRDLDHMLACSPVLETLALALNSTSECVHLTSQSLQCVLLWLSMVEEVAVVDAPHLERIILWHTFSVPVKIKIASAPELRVLGYLEPRVLWLQIGDNVIKADTKVSPSTLVPSVKILALKVNLGVFKEVKMMASFPRCFPNVDMLHIESAIADRPTGRHRSNFWWEIHPIGCLNSNVKKIVLHEFRGDQSEFEFLKFIGRSAQELLALLIIWTKEKYASADEVNKLTSKLGMLSYAKWASEE